MTYHYYDFFAGGGMAGYGLGQRWRCLFANDIDTRKAEIYRKNHNGGAELLVGDVNALRRSDVPGCAVLAWASFPCQDLSLAGAGAGLKGHRSGAFWPFWNLMQSLRAEGRAPNLVVLENVCGAITSHGGRDFAAIIDALSSGGYRCGAIVIDAIHFVPQSRPRLFIVGVKSDLVIPSSLLRIGPDPLWHPRALVQAWSRLPDSSDWIWWNIPTPSARNIRLSSLVEDEPTGVAWHSSEETSYLLGLMSEVNRKKVSAACELNRKVVGTVYRRTRPNQDGSKVQRAEVRFDEVAGCLRTPAGGSSRQTILVVEHRRVRSRLLSPREAARLMGLPDDYWLPGRYNDAYHLAGDGVVVPVVRHLAHSILEPILDFESELAAA